MTKLEQYLKEVEQRCEAATHSDSFEIQRYENSGLFSYQIEAYNEINDLIVVARTDEYGNMPKAKADAQFISSAYSDVPKLLEMVKYLIAIYNKPNELDHIDVKRYKERVTKMLESILHGDKE